jgi:3',5'-cyclic AMP phosphodiesterase CpdA
MKRLILLVLGLLTLLISCELDGWGWLWSSDVDDRFRESQNLALLSLPPQSEPFSFVVIADTHVHSGTDTAAVFARLKTELLPTDRFVIVCGDLVQHGAREDFDSYVAQTATLGIPCFSVPGNHDLYNSGWYSFRDILGRSMYDFSTGTIRVIGLDSASGTLGGLQRAWLEGVLANRTEPYCVVFTHFQLFSDDITETQQWTDIDEAYSLMHLLETSGVNYHFMGHSHKNLERTINGTNYCVVADFHKSFIRVSITAGGISHQYLDL